MPSMAKLPSGLAGAKGQRERVMSFIVAGCVLLVSLFVGVVLDDIGRPHQQNFGSAARD
jgi:hypothetical protein